MHRVRGWTAGLISRIDWMVTQVENHESLAASAIREVQQNAARARVQLGRVRRDGEALRCRAAEAREGATTWRDRARECGDDESRALECLRRGRRAAQRSTELERRLAEHDRVEKQLAKDVARIDERLSELRERHNVLRTRQSRAHALATVREAGSPAHTDPADLFERWETQVTEREIAGDCTQGEDGMLGNDTFADEFDAREEEEALREELRALRGESSAPERAQEGHGDVS